MPVIKGNTAAPDAAVGKLAALNIAQFTEQAQRIVMDARTEANAILAAAKAEAAQVAEQAQAEGYAAGHAKGLAEGQADGAERAFTEAHEGFAAQTEKLQQILRMTVEQLEQSRDRLLQQGREEMLEFALTIARKITHIQAAGDIEAAQANLAGALQMASCSGTIQIRVCPSQLDELNEYASAFMEDMGLSAMTRFVAADELSPGDVVVQTPNGEVDARVQTQLDNVIYAITGRSSEN